MTNQKRDEAAKKLGLCCEEKNKVNAHAMKRFEQKLSPIFTPEMLEEIDSIDFRIRSLCEAIRAANASETQKDRDARGSLGKEMPLH